jgi:hypothetical protein
VLSGTEASGLFRDAATKLSIVRKRSIVATTYFASFFSVTVTRRKACRVLGWCIGDGCFFFAHAYLF